MRGAPPALATFAVVLCFAAPSAGAERPASELRGGYLQVIRPDYRPPLVGEREAADSLFGPGAESARGDGIAESRRPALEALVRRFAPTLILPKGDHVRRGERTWQLLPVHPLVIADTLRIDRIQAAPYGIRLSLDVPFRHADPESLAGLVTAGAAYLSDPDDLETLYFDFPGTNPSGWWNAYAGFRSGPDSAAWSEPVVFAHPFLDSAGELFIQYWYFYPFNDYLGNHEGDWEHVSVGVTADRQRVASVHYHFHGRSVVLPDGFNEPILADSTHPVLYVGGRGYMVIDYPVRLFGGERNAGSHGCYPYPGEWEGAAGLGTTESVSTADEESLRVVTHDRFRVLLTPEPGRVDYLRHPEVLAEWGWLLLPVRWGFPSAPSIGGDIRFADTGNQAPFGPAYNAGWNRTAPGLSYPRYPMRRLAPLRSIAEDLVQPWYWLYAFRTPRFIPDARREHPREELELLGLAPRGGGAERGIGGTLAGLSVGVPRGALGDAYDTSVGFFFWRSLWVKGRIGAFELMGGYQKFHATDPAGGSLLVYPFTAGLAVRANDAVLRPYASMGAGAYGWEARSPSTLPDAQVVTSGWRFGVNAALGIEYYLRPRLALDLSVRLHDCGAPGERSGLGDEHLRFFTVQAGHYVRF